MKLSKKQETDIWKVYNTWLNSYINGDVKTYNLYLDKDYHFIGSTNNEEFLNKKDTSNFFKKTADQLAGKTQIKNEIKIIEKFEDLVFITHLFDAWFLIGDEWTYYGRYRFTNALKENKDGWRFIYQHFSMPDTKAQVGETLGAEKVTKENQELRDAIKRRTVELEQKNRELEIEAALERVRTQSMGMQSSEDLSKVTTEMFNQLRQFKADLFATGIVFCDKHKGHVEQWHSLPDAGMMSPFIVPIDLDYIHQYRYDQWKKGTELFSIEIPENIIEQHFNDIFQLPSAQKVLKEFEANNTPMPSTPEWEIDYGASFKYGYLLVSSLQPFKEADILPRFAKVFEQTYTRFLDLQKVEAQAREAQIDLALERIRSQAMAMKESSDLLDIVVTMRNEFIKLGHEAHYFWHMMWLPEAYEKAMTSGDGTKIGFVMKLPRHMHGDIPLLAKWEKSKKPTVVYTMNADEAINYVDKMVDLGDFKSIDPQAPSHNDIRHIEGLTFIMARTSHGEIGYSLPGIVKNPPKEDIDILIQFSGAFDLAHRRFLDLQKSEKQARETQIELALEKVRSRTMAMQRSEELADVASVLFLQVKELGIEQWTCGFNIWETGDTEFKYFPGGPDGKMLPSCMVPLMEHPVFQEFVASKKRGDALMVYEKEGDIQKDHYKYMLSLPGIGDMLQDVLDQGMEFPDFQIDHVANFAYGNIVFITYQPVPEMHDVFKRFAKVFEQTYTRFLDLQKVEAQAKEAQIEASLERVRSRSIGMQSSEELKEVIQVIHDQLVHLNFDIDAAGFTLDYHQNNDWNTWIANKSESLPSLMFIPYIDHPQFHYYKSAKEKGLDFLANTLSFEDKNSIFNYMFGFMGDYPQAEKDELLNKPGLAISQVFLKNISLWIYNLDAVPYSEEVNSILMRFAKVFQQTYTRFLDLQKAESQVRESEIELALERVRARTMAMHKSEELKEVVKVIFDQLAHLKINAEHAGIVVDFEPKKDFHFWVADNLNIPAKISVPYLDLPWDKQFTEAKKKGTDFFTTQLNFDEKNRFYKKLLPHIEGITKEAEDFYLNCPGLTASTVIQKDIGLYIENFSGIPFPDEENSILKRFGKVFQQTYTRFLDLQKAEAQARKAQIEVALERVRNRSMAMQKSSELLEAGELLWNEITKLGIDCFTSGYVLFDDSENIGWNYTPNPSTGKILEQAIGIPHKQTPPMRKITASWKKLEQLCVVALNRKQTIAHQTFVAEKGINFPFSAKQLVEISPKEIVLHTFNFKQGYLLIVGSEKLAKTQIDVMLRFTKVFQQTYTRFLDLQKAEAQAKEAQIEMALEKVRSRTMAMQNSSELPEAANNLFLQVQEIGIPAWSAGYCIWEEENKKSVWCNMSSEGEIQKGFSLPTIGEGYNFDKPLKNGDAFHVAELGGKKLVKHYDFMKTLPGIGEVLKDFAEKGISLPTFQIFHIVYFTHGYLMFITYEAVPNDWDVFKRFGKVFEQTYTRFLDLQKAEAQAREAQIEMALEKVRSRTMAMQKGEEVKDVVVLLYKELIALGVTNFATCGYVEINEETNRQATWVTSPGGDSLGLFHLPLTGDVHFDERYEAWKKQQTVFHQTVAGKERKKHLEYAITTFNSKEAEEMVLNQFPDPTVFYCFNFSHGYLHLVSGSHLNKEEETLLARFTRVFEQTYARFLDLEKAEAQTRQAQINLAVERVRAKALAMHKSEEIMEVVAKLKDEVMGLDIPDVVASTIFLNEGDDKVRMWDLSSLEHEENYSEVPFDITFKLKKSDPHLYVKRVWENPKDYFVEIQDEKDFKRLMVWLREQDKKEIADEVEEFIEKVQLKRLYHVAKKLNNGKLVIDLLNPPSEEMESILTKMGAAFDLAYKRFEDLQKAEAQTREALIEAALEKVRSRSLAMHKPDELQEVISVVAEKLQELEVIFDSGGVILCTYFPDNKDVMHWIVTPDFSSSQSYYVPYFDNPIFNEAWESKNRGDLYFSKEFPVKAKNHFFEQAFKNSDYKHMPEDYKQHVLKADKHHLTAAWSKNSAILIPSLTDVIPSENDINIMIRFARVFEQAYIRFLDLQKSEAQAREAQIEAALERVRSRSMAMHKSEELLDVISVVSEQLEQLEFKFVHVSFANNEMDQDYKYWVSAKGQLKPLRFTIPYKNIAMFNRVKEAQKKSVSFYSDILTQEEHNQWHTHLLNHGGSKVFSKEENEFVMSRGMARSIAINPNIMLILANYASIPYSEEENKIIERFGKVFEQSYTRFLDLQKAEAQARESQIETGLERVRSRTLAMQTSDELAETSVIVFKQLLELGIAPHRLFIGIIKDKGKKIEAWATNEDGNKLDKHFTLEASKNKSIKKMLEGWKQKKKSLVIDMKGKELQNYFQYLNEEMEIPFIHGLEQKRRVQTVAYFSGGLIGMAAPEEQPEETIKLLERFASVFNLTYTRFNDLKVAEAQTKKAEVDLINLQVAKKSAEEALSELQLTQTQLIQSEKMASLGELTAGIAHEIQNPLNFVNNFSEVSKELLEEMLEEIENGDMDEVKAIMDDVIQNLEKINHHGKRADGIVKGMLQHSRSSTGNKEPTDINVLADEYLRLAYHGLRAKDKSFNATLVTDFDENIGKISIIPQDIGRVVLNLLTNAFYVVNEKKQLNISGYEPTVSLTTKKHGNWTTISVKDNGNGIPQKVLEKIFQPFFTTKPTGQGTGLGLSMSYDIVTKGHGGELNVNTEQNKGTEFIIKLPI